MALRGKYEQSHVAVKLIQWLGCMFLFFIPAMGSIFLFSLPLSISALKWTQLIQTAAIFLLPPLCMAYIWAPEPLKWLKVTGERRKIKGEFIWAIAIMLAALPAINLLSSWNEQMTLPTFLEPLEQWMKQQEEAAKILTDKFLSASTLDVLLVNLLLMAVLPALAEELTFRGVLQRLFQGSNVSDFHTVKVPHIAIWVTAILFSAIHMQFYGFLPRMLMGALFGYMLVWTGSLWVPILMHFTNNAMAVILYFVATRAGWDMEKVDAIGTGDTLWLGIVSIVLTIGGIYAFRRSTTMSNASSRISSGN
jgi:membrane protease YdiL (CAAX protease family)